MSVLGDDERMRGCRCVVAAGGDGTVADVVNMRLGLPVVHLPVGNENLFAREFGHGVGVEELADVIVDGEERVIDLGRVGERYFSLMLSVGYDATVAHLVQRRRSRRGGGVRRVSGGSYLWPMFEAICGYRFPVIELEADGEVARGSMALVFNVGQYGFGMRFAEHAVCDDGLLDWIVLEKRGVLAMARYAWHIRSGSHLKLPDVKHGRAKRIKISCEGGKGSGAVQADGDPAGFTPVDVDVEVGAMKVLVKGGG